MRLMLALLLALAAVCGPASAQTICSETRRADVAEQENASDTPVSSVPCTCTTGATAPSTLLNNLVSAWSLSVDGGDDHGANDLTNNNGVTFVPLGPSGVVADFTKASSESLTRTAIGGVNSTMTLSLWFKPLTLGIREGFVEHGTQGSAAGWALETSAVSQGDVLWFLGSDYAIYVHTAVDAVAPNVWAHVVITYDGTHGTPNSRPHIYVNGVDKALTYVGTPPTTLQVGDLFKLGVALTRFTDGQEGRVGLWSRTLSAADVLELYSSGRGQAYSALTTAQKVSLVSYWNLDEASGNRADSHGSNTLTDNNTVGSVTNSYPANMPATVANFVAASNQDLSRADESSLEFATDFTVAAWVKATTLPGSAARIVSDVASGSEGYSLNYNAGRFRFTDMFSTVDANDGGAGVSVDTWYFVLGWRDTSNVWHLRVNATTYDGATDGGNLDNTGPFRIGARNVVATEFWDGIISSPLVWSRALTAAERDCLYASGAGAFYPFTGVCN